MAKNINIYPRNKRHFRGHKDIVKGKIKYHPNYVFGETEDNYYSYGITEEEKYDKYHKNYALTCNPNKNKRYKQSYIHKKHRSDKKDKYTVKFTNYTFHPKDKEYIDDKIDKKFK